MQKSNLEGFLLPTKQRKAKTFFKAKSGKTFTCLPLFLWL